jgi:hypothetical protein
MVRPLGSLDRPSSLAMNDPQRVQKSLHSSKTLLQSYKSVRSADAQPALK